MPTFNWFRKSKKNQEPSKITSVDELFTANPAIRESFINYGIVLPKDGIDKKEAKKVVDKIEKVIRTEKPEKITELLRNYGFSGISLSIGGLLKQDHYLNKIKDKFVKTAIINFIKETDIKRSAIQEKLLLPTTTNKLELQNELKELENQRIIFHATSNSRFHKSTTKLIEELNDAVKKQNGEKVASILPKLGIKNTEQIEAIKTIATATESENNIIQSLR